MRPTAGWPRRRPSLSSASVPVVLDALVVWGFQDEAGVMILGDAIDNFGIAVGRGIGMLLAGQAENDAGVIAADGREGVRLLSCSHFEVGPLTPQIDAAGGFDYFRDVGAANTRGDF